MSVVVLGEVVEELVGRLEEVIVPSAVVFTNSLPSGSFRFVGG